MINYIVSGKAKFCYRGKTYELNSGDLSFFYLGEHNSFYPCSDNLEIYYFHLNGANIKQLFLSITQKFGNVFSSIPQQKITAFYEELKQSVNGENYFFQSSCLIYNLLLYLYFLVEQAKKRHPPLIEKIFQSILDHNVSVISLANELGYNPIYLERQFKFYTGKSLSNYILNKKLDKACNLLLNSNLSVSQIADNIGYSSSKGLIYAFKNNYGITPLEFKRKYKNSL